MKQIEANIWIINSMDSSWVVSGESSRPTVDHPEVEFKFCAKWPPWNGDICDPLWLPFFILILFFDVRLSPLCVNQPVERI